MTGPQERWVRRTPASPAKDENWHSSVATWTHGYPDSFLRFSKLIPLLTDSGAHGGDPADAFDVVVPSSPGFGFSQQPDSVGMTFRVGDLWHKVMTEELGYARFGAHGGDWGSTITEHLRVWQPGSSKTSNR